MIRRRATDADIRAFMTAIYPTAPDLALASFDEHTVLVEATLLITQLRQECDALRQTLQDTVQAQEVAEREAEALRVELNRLRDYATPVEWYTDYTPAQRKQIDQLSMMWRMAVEAADTHKHENRALREQVALLASAFREIAGFIDCNQFLTDRSWRQAMINLLQVIDVGSLAALPPPKGPPTERASGMVQARLREHVTQLREALVYAHGCLLADDACEFCCRPSGAACLCLVALADTEDEPPGTRALREQEASFKP